MSLKWCNNTPLSLSVCFIIATLGLLIPRYCLASSFIQIKNLTHINKIAQDKKGFIWLAGQHGLTRFDSENTVNFSIDNPNSPLPFNWINDFIQVNEDVVLATETEGLHYLNTRSGRNKPLFGNIAVGSIYNIALFKGDYYFQTKDSLYVYQTKNKEIQLIASNIYIKSFALTNQNLYVASKSGLYSIEKNQLTQIFSDPITTTAAINDTVITVIENRIVTINDNGDRNTIFIKESVDIVTKTFDGNSFFTINNQGIISKYSLNDLSKLRHGYKRERKSRVRTFFHDKSGVLWVATNLGVEQLYENTIIEHPKIFDIKTNANEIALFANEIVIGSYGAGLKNFFTEVFNQNTNNNFSKRALKITNTTVVNNDIYMATFDGVWIYNKLSNEVKRLPFPNNNELTLKVRYKSGILFIASNDNGMYAYDVISEKILWNIRLDHGLSSNEVIDILPLANEKFWIATSKGLDIYDAKKDTIRNLNIPEGNKLVSVVYANQKIYAASLGNGIFAFNQNGQLLTHIGQGISFSGLLVYKDDIWATARPGLYKLSVNNHQLSMLENTGEYSFVGSSLVKGNVLYSSYYGGILELSLSERPVFHSNVLISKTTISGKSYLLNKSIEVNNSNDLITLDLASLDFRPGLEKRYRYKINNNKWQTINGSQLTLTGLASGEYNIEIMGTNSLGQWSDISAYTEIHVAYPWYWTPEIKIAYVILFLFITLLTSWLLYLRARSINHIHNLLKDDMRNYGRLMKTTERNLTLSLDSLVNNEVDKGRALIEKTLSSLQHAVKAQEPDNLGGGNLAVAIPFLASYIENKYDVKLHSTVDDKIDSLHYELKADIYKVIFEAIMSSIFKNASIKFNLNLQEVKNKIWLTINSDNNSFSQFDSKVNFDLASYTIRQITNKHHASLNTFDNEDGSSQLVISFPLMQLS